MNFCQGDAAEHPGSDQPFFSADGAVENKVPFWNTPARFLLLSLTSSLIIFETVLKLFHIRKDYFCND